MTRSAPRLLLASQRAQHTGLGCRVRACNEGGLGVKREMSAPSTGTYTRLKPLEAALTLGAALLARAAARAEFLRAVLYISERGRGWRRRRRRRARRRGREESEEDVGREISRIPKFKVCTRISVSARTNLAPSRVLSRSKLSRKIIFFSRVMVFTNALRSEYSLFVVVDNDGDLILLNGVDDICLQYHGVGRRRAR